MSIDVDQRYSVGKPGFREDAPTPATLVKLHRLYRDTPTLKQRVAVPVNADAYLEFAEFFIDARGHHVGRTGRNPSFGAYGQDDLPLAHQKSVEGHAVRSLVSAKTLRPWNILP